MKGADFPRPTHAWRLSDPHQYRRLSAGSRGFQQGDERTPVFHVKPRASGTERANRTRHWLRFPPMAPISSGLHAAGADVLTFGSMRSSPLGGGDHDAAESRLRARRRWRLVRRQREMSTAGPWRRPVRCSAPLPVLSRVRHRMASGGAELWTPRAARNPPRPSRPTDTSGSRSSHAMWAIPHHWQTRPPPPSIFPSGPAGRPLVEAPLPAASGVRISMSVGAAPYRPAASLQESCRGPRQARTSLQSRARTRTWISPSRGIGSTAREGYCTSPSPLRDTPIHGAGTRLPQRMKSSRRTTLPLPQPPPRTGISRAPGSTANLSANVPRETFARSERTGPRSRGPRHRQPERIQVLTGPPAPESTPPPGDPTREVARSPHRAISAGEHRRQQTDGPIRISHPHRGDGSRPRCPLCAGADCGARPGHPTAQMSRARRGRSLPTPSDRPPSSSARPGSYRRRAGTDHPTGPPRSLQQRAMGITAIASEDSGRGSPGDKDPEPGPGQPHRPVPRRTLR